MPQRSVQITRRRELGDGAQKLGQTGGLFSQ